MHLENNIRIFFSRWNIVNKIPSSHINTASKIRLFRDLHVLNVRWSLLFIQLETLIPVSKKYRSLFATEIFEIQFIVGICINRGACIVRDRILLHHKIRSLVAF